MKMKDVTAVPAEAEPITTTRSILVVDDDRAVADTFSRMLVLEGFAVATALNAESGLELADQARPDSALRAVATAKPSSTSMREKVSATARSSSTTRMLRVVVIGSASAGTAVTPFIFMGLPVRRQARCSQPRPGPIEARQVHARILGRVRSVTAAIPS
ncbi:MAG: hypothetical protein ABIG85_04810 [Chloroflexota bacterium]